MAIVDERGRLFGRFNLFDTLVAILVLWLIPIAYGGYLLLRTPLPTLDAIEPSTLVYGTNMRIRVRGTNFVPYLRISVGKHQGMTFKFNDRDDADVDLPDVPPGVYDVILFDNAQERGRIPNGLTIAPSVLPQARLITVGTFGNLTAEQAATITAGTVIEGIGVVEQVGKLRPQAQRVFVRPANVEIPLANAQMLPAVLRMSCFVRSSQGQPECVGGGFSIQKTTLLFFDMPFGKVPFQIDQVRSVRPLETIRVTARFSGDARILAQMQTGDMDLNDIPNELAAAARIEHLDPPGGQSRVARLNVPAQRDGSGWLYNDVPLRLGSLVAFRTRQYEVQALVIEVSANGGVK